MALRRAALLLAFAAAPSLLGGCAPSHPAVAPDAHAQPPVAPTKLASPASIGEATMEPDGTIVLRLRAEDPSTGAVGDGLFRYPPSHAQYEMIRKHVGPIKPGESRPVPPFADGK